MVPVTVERTASELHVDAGPLRATVAIGARTPVTLVDLTTTVEVT